MRSRLYRMYFFSALSGTRIRTYGCGFRCVKWQIVISVGAGKVIVVDVGVDVDVVVDVDTVVELVAVELVSVPVLLESAM